MAEKLLWVGRIVRKGEKISIMKCPTCSDSNLLMTERQGVEIDYCPQCRGVWLDRGELDKIIERSTPVGPAPEGRHALYDRIRSDDHHMEHAEHGRYGHKRGWLGELFD
jgi:uncharacterized protein